MHQAIERQAEIDSLGRLSNPQAEEAFQRAKLSYTRRRLRFICCTTGAAYLGAIYSDSQIIAGSVFTLLAWARIVTAMTALIPLILTFNKKSSPARLGLTAGFYMTALMVTECLELFLKADVNTMRETPITVLIVLMFYLFQTPQIWQPLIVGSLGSAAYLLILVFSTNATPDYIMNTTLVFALSNAFGLYFCIRFGTAQRREHHALTQLKRRAETDALTGIFNRRRIMELSEQEFKRAKRYGHPCSLLIMDIDHFKLINDTVGHAAGDEVLVSMTDRCVRKLRDVDIFGRIGGEEFAILMPHSTMEQAMLAAERIRETVGDTPFRVGDKELAVTISIGAASLTPETETMDILFRQADNALYEAKRLGRNGVQACPLPQV